MIVLITGGTGFIGSRIARRLVAEGHTPVCLDLIPNPSRLGNVNGAKIAQGDVTSVEELIDVIKENGVASIVHTARSGAKASLQTFFRVAAYGTNCVFEAARIAGVRRVVFCSSIAYHGPQERFGERAVTEDDPGFPEGPYAAFKLVNEVMARAYNARHDMDIIAVRPAIVYGPGKAIGWRWLNEIAINPALGKPYGVPFPKDYRVSALHVDDNAALFARLATVPSVAHRVYHTGGETISAGQLGSIVRKFVPNAEIAYSDRVVKEEMIYLIDNSRAKNEFGLSYKTVEAGTHELINEARGTA